MNIQNTLDLIPADLFNEIFLRLPSKSIGRCPCVSKILASRLGSEDFKELFLTRSLTRPRLLFDIKSNLDARIFYSSPQPQYPYEKSCLEVRADFLTKFSSLIKYEFSYASGLLYFSGMGNSTVNGEYVICNPSTGEYVILPERRTSAVSKKKLGFDPIDKQFKLLEINTALYRGDNHWIGFVLTLGTGKMRSRTIQCPLLRDRYICSNGISINGILYYLTRRTKVYTDGWSYVIVCFNLRTEAFKFKHIVIDIEDGPYHSINYELINYKGKLGITILGKEYSNKTIDLYMLVLEEEHVEKQELSKYTLTLSIKFDCTMYVVGMTSTDEIVLSTTSSTEFYLYYFNLENNSLYQN